MTFLAMGTMLASGMLLFFSEVLRAEPEPSPKLANPVEQRAEMIEELRTIKTLLREQNHLLREQIQLLRKLLATHSGGGVNAPSPAAVSVDCWIDRSDVATRPL